MDLPDLVLALLPPATAIVIELLNPLNERFFERQKAAIATDELNGLPTANNPDLPQAIDIFGKVLTQAMVGAAALAGLAPTLVTFVVTLAAIVHPLGDSIYLWALVVFLEVVLIFSMLRIITGLTPAQIAIRKVTIFGRATLPAAKFISWLVLATNAIAFFGFIGVYAINPK